MDYSCLAVNQLVSAFWFVCFLPVSVDDFILLKVHYVMFDHIRDFYIGKSGNTFHTYIKKNVDLQYFKLIGFTSLKMILASQIKGFAPWRGLIERG